jgi:hypothetical protein
VHREATPAAAEPAEPADPVTAARTAFRFFGKRWLPLFLLWSPVAAVAIGVNVAETLLGRSYPASVQDWTLSQFLQYLGLALPLEAVGAFVQLAFWTLVAAYAVPRMRGAPRGSLRAALRRPGAVAALALVLALSLAAGILLLVVTFFVFVHWFLYAPSALAEGDGVARAMTRSRAFARARRPLGFTALVVLVGVAVWVAGLALSQPEALALRAAGMPGDVASAVAQALGAWPLAPLAPLLPAAYWAIAADAGARAEGASAPAAARADRRTTKCPRCGALVRLDAPAGASVDVTCPACGQRGRVIA